MHPDTRADSATSRATGPTGITRRTVTRGLAWTAPVVLTSVTVPAFAASTPCLEGKAALQPTESVVKVLTFGASGVLADLIYTAVDKDGKPLSDQTPEETGWIRPTPYTPRWYYIKLHHPSQVATGNVITLTISFRAEVRNLSLKLTDIDKNTLVGAPNRWIDEVVVTPVATVSARGGNVVGAGTATSRFSSNTNANIETNAGDVTLSWAGPLKVVTIAYTAAGTNNVNDWGQQVGVGEISFSNCY